MFWHKHKHEWRFSHNHGITIGDVRSWRSIDAGFANGSIYPIYQCRCGKQARQSGEHFVILEDTEKEQA